MSNELTPVRRGQVTSREEFGAREVQTQAETGMSAATARERAIIEAEYLMAERHPRNWMNVRAEMIEHCKRPRFADVARYAKPVGKKLINGEWVEEFARGWSARFAETLAQEMRNIKPWSQVTFEDETLRIVRFGVTDLQNNLARSREVTFAKVTEKRGKKRKGSADEWDPPDGREVLGVRTNTRGEPVFLCRATEDEMRQKVNSEESKTQRDFVLRMCQRDILEECEDQYRATMEAEDKRDPQAALKKLLDRFHEFGIMPSDLETYMTKPVRQFTTVDIQQLRELGAAIRDGQTTFQEALKARFSEAAPDEEETPQQHDARLQRQMSEQAARKTAERVADEKIAAAKVREQPQSEEIPEVNELPDPESVSYTKCVYQGIPYTVNEDNTAWRRLEPTQSPAAAPAEAKTEDPSRRLRFGRKQP